MTYRCTTSCLGVPIRHDADEDQVLAALRLLFAEVFSVVDQVAAHHLRIAAALPRNGDCIIAYDPELHLVRWDLHAVPMRRDPVDVVQTTATRLAMLAESGFHVRMSIDSSVAFAERNRVLFFGPTPELPDAHEAACRLQAVVNQLRRLPCSSDRRDTAVAALRSLFPDVSPDYMTEAGKTGLAV